MTSTPEDRARIEALVGSADGIVTAEAKAFIEDALKHDAKNARARFFEGLARQQEGDIKSALAAWTALLKDSASDESWVPDLRNRIRELNADADPVLPDAVTASRPQQTSRSPGRPQSPRAIEKGPSAEDMQTAEAMPPADRSIMIRVMVDGLADRLEQSPRDADGWIKLMRSRVVLGESELARQALARGLAVFAEDAPERDRIVAAAHGLGLN